MNKLEIIKFLMEDTAKEIEKDSIYDKALKEAHKKVKENKEKSINYGYWYYMPEGITRTSRQHIKDNLKMIRRLSLDIEKEL